MNELKEEKRQLNGFDTTQLNGLIGNLKENPEAGNITFQCRTCWQDGARAFHHFSGYDIDGKRMHEEKRKFVVLSDEPSEFGVSDAAPGPAEQLLGALGGCITATTNAFAALKNIKLGNLEVEVTGELNIQGMFALMKDVPVGFKTIKVKVIISGDAPENDLMELAESGFKFSAIRNTVSQGAPVDLSISM